AVSEPPAAVGVGGGLLGGTGVGAEPGGYAARRRDRVQLCKFCVAVETVAALPLERGCAVTAHSLAVPDDDLPEDVPPCLPGGPHRREDSAARCEELLVGRTDGAQRELSDSVSRKRGRRVTVHKARDRGKTRAVELLDVGVVQH